MEQLFQLLNAIHPMSGPLSEYLVSVLRSLELPKKGFVLKAGRVCENVYFISKGMVRCFYMKDDVEICSWFMKEGDVIFSVKSFYTQTPGYEYIQVLEDAAFYYISYQELQYIYKTFVEFNYIRGVLTEKYYLLSEERNYSMRMQRAHERYNYIKENHAELISRVPSKYLASYLGITEETLSRIRSGKKY
jgi:signal-transduction protein with cAMP-binding, CBS, and nucleotidyltransferase domain